MEFLVCHITHVIIFPNPGHVPKNDRVDTSFFTVTNNPESALVKIVINAIFLFLVKYLDVFG